MQIQGDNIDAATAAELQKFMEDHGVVEINMRNPNGVGWTYKVTLTSGAVLFGGPYDDMAAAMKHIVRSLEEN